MSLGDRASRLVNGLGVKKEINWSWGQKYAYNKLATPCTACIFLDFFLNSIPSEILFMHNILEVQYSIIKRDFNAHEIINSSKIVFLINIFN